MKLVITKVETGVDGLERFKINVDFLLLALVCYNGTAIDNLEKIILINIGFIIL